MKTAKKLISLFCAVALLVSCFAFSASVNAAGLNVALTATAYDNLNGNNQNGNGPSLINDGSTSTRWTGPTTHASGDIPGTTTGEWNVWLLWDEAQSIDEIKINWEDCYGKAFTVATSSDGVNFDNVVFSGGAAKGWQTISLASSLSVMGVGVFITEKANTWGVAIWELEVYDNHANVYDTEALEASLALADKTFGDTGNTYGYTSDSWSAYVSARGEAMSAVGACKGKLIGTVAGFSDQAAFDAVAEAFCKSVFGLRYDGEADSLLYNGIMAYDTGNLTSYCSGHNFRSLTDGSWGNDTNNYQPDPDRSRGATVYIKPAADSIAFNMLQVYAESAGYNFSVYYTDDDMSDACDMSTFFAHNWRLIVNSGSAELTDLGNSTRLYEFDFNTVTATAICIVYNGSGWYKLREVAASFDPERPDTPEQPGTPEYPPMPEEPEIPDTPQDPPTAPVTLFTADFENKNESGVYATGDSKSLLDTSVAHGGEASFKVFNRTQNWNAAEWSMGARMTPGGTFRFSAWVYHEGKSPVMFQLSFKINDGEDYTYCVRQRVMPKTWTYVIGQYTVSENERSLNPYIEEISDTAAFWVDDIVLTQTGGYVADASIERNIVSLKNVFAGTGVTVGTAIGPWAFSDGTGNQAELIKKHFDTIALENQLKADFVLDYAESVSDLERYNEAPALNFSAAEPFFEFAKENGLTIAAQCLVWYQMTPDWFFYEDFDVSKSRVSRELMLTRLENYIKGVLEWCETNYPGIATTWIVVNEAVSDNPVEVRNDNFRKTIGDDYIAKTFEFANKYRPASGCRYLYNDYNIESYPEKLDFALNYLTECGAIENGWVDGIGFQCHIALDSPSPDMMKTQMMRDAALGLRCEVIDIKFGDSDIAKYDSEYLAQNALRERYRQVIKAFMEAKADGLELKNITWWGLTDEYTWLVSQHHEPQYPLLFDAHNKAKPAFYGVVEAIRPELTALDDLALNKPVGSSGRQGESVPAQNAVDGNEYTRWVSQKSDPDAYYLWVELGDEPVKFNDIRIKWESSYATAFKIQVKDFDPDVNEGWTDITGELSVSAVGWREIALSGNVSARYVRLYATKKSSENGIAISEFGIYLDPFVPDPDSPSVVTYYIGEDDEVFPIYVGIPGEDTDPIPDLNPNLAILRYENSTASSAYDGANVAEHAFDGDLSTIWQAQEHDNVWLTLELDGILTVRCVIFKWRNITPNGTGVLEVSTDGESWTKVADGFGDLQLKDGEAVVFDAIEAKYIRFSCTGNDSDKNVAPEMREMEVYEFDPTDPDVSPVAAQQSFDGSTRTVRFIAAVRSEFENNVSTEYDAVGFRVSVYDPDHEGMSSFRMTDTLVYDAIVTAGNTYTGAEFGIEGGKLFMLTVNNVPDNATFIVRAYAVNKNGDEIYGNMLQPTVVTIENGELTVE